MSTPVLHLLPCQSAPAAANMAIDLALLGIAGSAGSPGRLRTYGWTEPAVTFGYGQDWTMIRTMPAATGATLVRRPTGGGLVEHRHDCTYALILPPAHPWFRLPAGQVYRSIHGAVAAALAAAGRPAALQPCAVPGGASGSAPAAAGPRGPALCFARPEPADVIDPASGGKIAGAALKRSRAGLLVQGSIDLTLAPQVADRAAFGHLLAAALAAAWGGALMPAPLPELPDLDRYCARFAADSWTCQRRR
jgi:lipoate-protein ligase A